MGSHGAPRYKSREERSHEAHQQELRKIEKYQDLSRLIRAKVAEHQYTPETLEKISELLTSNPEYYTVWNYRRRVLQHLFSSPATTDSDERAANERVAGLIRNDLQFLIPLLRSFPKCYWIWNHRLWLLEQTSKLLPIQTARKFWQEELALVSKMLGLDGRNFHGWGYRRFVVESLEKLTSDDGGQASMSQEEFNYAKKMIATNLSNFSAWHYRTKLIQRLLDEKSASDDERRRMLDEELELIHRALCDPYDQSLWFYHQNLMCTFDPAVSNQTMAPNLTNSERLDYLQQEIDAIQDMLDGAEDCKYIYQALIDCTLLSAKVKGTMSKVDKQNVAKWLSELKTLDPLRRGRWTDFEKTLSTIS